MRLAALGLTALLYGVIAFGANPVAASDLSDAQRTELKDLRDGQMKRLVFHKEARPRIDETFRDKHGNAVTIADYDGKVVVLNFWATWCPPCRAEMPSIDRLSGEVAGDDVAVVALSMDRFDVDRIIKFFDEIDVQNLKVLQDRNGAVARRAGALGLPITLILDRQGREIARYTGDAEWDSDEVKTILSKIVEMTAPEA